MKNCAKYVSLAAIAAWLALGCAAAGVSDAETDAITSQTGEAAVLAFDKPPIAAAVQARWGEFGNTSLWVFACDSNHQLKRKVRDFVDQPFSTWQVVSFGSGGPPGCQDGITVGSWARPSVQQIFLYMRGTDNKIWQLWYNMTWTGSIISSGWSNISADSGIGTITGAPRLISYYAYDDSNMYLNLGVTTDVHNLFVVSSDGFQWSFQHVFRSATDSRTVATSNSIAIRNQVWNTQPSVSPGVLAGRGLWTTDDSNAWVATFTAGRWAVTDSWTGSSGIPTFWRDDHSIARFGTALKSHDWGSSSWQTEFSCENAAAGSPQVVPDGLDTDLAPAGFVTGVNGELVYYNTLQEGFQLVQECFSLGGNMNSAPYVFGYKLDNGSAEVDVLFKGSNGNLWIYRSGTFSDMGLKLL